MAKNNHKRPKIVELKFRAIDKSILKQARIEWLEGEILRLELSVLLLHGDSDPSVKRIPDEQAWRGIFEQDEEYVRRRIQSSLGDRGIVATKGNVKDALERISKRFEAYHKEDDFTVRQFTPYDMEYWIERARSSPEYFNRKKA